MQIKAGMDDRMPELLFMTGGVSRLPAMREWCQEVFPDAIVVTGPEPEFSVARGLAYTGRIDEDMKEFRMEVGKLIESSLVEQIVSRHMDGLYDALVDALTEPMCEQLLMKIFDRWKSGEIRRLTEIDEQLKKGLEEWIKEDETQKLISGVISGWLKSVAYDLEEYTMPICLKHNIPYKALNLTGQIAPTDLEIKIDTKDMFGVDQFTWLINAIVSVLVGIICGGNGIALIAGGIQGIMAGTILSMLVLLIGREHIEKRMMDINIPTAIRKLVPRGQFASRIRKMIPETKARFHKELKWDKNAEISERMAAEISGQIEQCLSRMAEVVEIPLG
jgi:hypothetical protein